MDEYGKAVDQELVNAGLDCTQEDDTEYEAKKKLLNLVDWHVAVATDPAVNGGYSLQKVHKSKLKRWVISLFVAVQPLIVALLSGINLTIGTSAFGAFYILTILCFFMSWTFPVWE